MAKRKRIKWAVLAVGIFIIVAVIVGTIIYTIKQSDSQSRNQTQQATLLISDYNELHANTLSLKQGTPEWSRALNAERQKIEEIAVFTKGLGITYDASAKPMGIDKDFIIEYYQINKR